jgi:hypothetical protein
VAGWPNLISRLALGPALENVKPVKNNKRQLGAEVFKLAWWQLAGCGIMVPRCWAALRGSDAGAFSAASLLGSGEAWDPDSLYLPTIARVSAGVYTLEYGSTYPDADGVAAATNLSFGWGHALGATANRVVVVERVDDRTLKARVTTGTTAAPVDSDLIVFGR